jgi:hypothetical protein
VPRLCELYTDICLTTEEKARKNLSQNSRRVPVGTMKTEYLQMAPIYCPERSVNTYQHTLRNIPEDRRFRHGTYCRETYSESSRLLQCSGQLDTTLYNEWQCNCYMFRLQSDHHRPIDTKHFHRIISWCVYITLLVRSHLKFSISLQYV